MDLAALIVATAALMTSVCIVLVARHEVESLRAVLSHALTILSQLAASAQRTRSHAEGARAEAVATRSELRVFCELLRELQDQAMGPQTVRPEKLRREHAVGAQGPSASAVALPERPRREPASGPRELPSEHTPTA